MQQYRSSPNQKILLLKTVSKYGAYFAHVVIALIPMLFFSVYTVNVKTHHNNVIIIQYL